MEQGSAMRERYVMGDLVLDVAAVSLVRGEATIKLPGLTFDLLLCLVRRAPWVVSRDALLDEIWPGAHVGEETLKQRVRLLRKALGDDSKAPRYIETIRGKGYKLIAPVTRLADEVRHAQVKPKATPAHKTGWRFGTALLILPLLALLFWLMPSQTQLSEPPIAMLPVSENLSALELFERGKVYYLRYLPVDNESSIRLLRQSVAADPSFAKANALLSKAYSQQPKLGNGYFGAQAHSAAQQAIRLAPDQPEGYIALGLFYDVACQPSKGIEAYRQALAIQPDHAIAIANVAYDFMTLGRLDEALIWNLRSMALLPNIHFVQMQLGDTLRLLGIHTKARAWLEKTVTLQPDNILARISYCYLLLLEGQFDLALNLVKDADIYPWGRNMAINSQGDIAFFRGDLVTARACFEKTWSSGNEYGGYRLGLVLHRLGAKDAQDQLSRTEKKYRATINSVNELPGPLLHLAVLAAENDRSQEAMDWLADAIDAGWTDVRWLMLDPGLESLRQMPGFENQLEALRTRIATMRLRVLDQNLIP